MTGNVTSLSKIESTLLSTLSAEGKNIFTVDDASAVIGKGRAEIRNILSTLSKKSWIDRIERGKYLKNTLLRVDLKLIQNLVHALYAAIRKPVWYSGI